jgi:carboxymethylenebutenolidase
MTTKQITIEASDGPCNVYIARPEGKGEFASVLLYPDGMGVRPAIREIADRIAKQGFYVLLPDIFYRTPGQLPPPSAFFSDPTVRAAWQKEVVPTVTPANVMKDTERMLDYLASQKEVARGPIGITGYCMGGRLAVYAAGHFGGRVAAAAAFHPGGLATDSPESPHRLAPQITARLHIGAAMDDRSFDEAQQARLREAFDASNVNYTMETYPAKHGWVPRDTPVHDAAQAERHYLNLFALLGSTLTV